MPQESEPDFQNMLPKLETLRLEDLTSSIGVTFRRGYSATTTYLDILIVSYTGQYPFGSSGNSDAHYMFAMGNAALHAYSPSGVIIDMSELHYEWGDMLEMVFGIGSDQYVDAEFRWPQFVGPHCREAVRTLIHGGKQRKQIEDIGWVFESLEAAWEYVDSLLNKKA